MLNLAIHGSATRREMDTWRPKWRGPISITLLTVAAVLLRYTAEALAFSTLATQKRSIYDLPAILAAASLVDSCDSGTGLFSRTELDESPDHSTDKNIRTVQSSQAKSVLSDAPAVLLKSGPGTGKTYALASRIGHLIRSGAARPEQMVVLSFTNRDAQLLKDRSLEMMFERSEEMGMEKLEASKRDVSSRLWSGTIHAFSSSIIRSHSRSKKRFRVLTSKEIRSRVDRCLHAVLDEKRYTSQSQRTVKALKRIRIAHRDALADVQQSRGMVIHQIGRCLEIWKEARLLSPPTVVGVDSSVMEEYPRGRSLRDTCLELSTRLGISQNVALLALYITPEYQSLQAIHSTADPSDLASIAYGVLISDKKALARFHGKLKHIIVDEYQDVSVAQHALIRLIVRGDTARGLGSSIDMPPVLETKRPTDLSNDDAACFSVPNLFCGGDSNQSIYGWRGAAPSLTVDNFRTDYPQGIVVSLDTCFRLSPSSWDTASAFIGDGQGDARGVKSFNCRKNKKVVRVADGSATLPMLLSSDTNDLGTPIRIEGLWDAREEAKSIAWNIRKRSKSRLKRFAKALSSLVGVKDRASALAPADIVDPSDVVIMVRSGNHLELIEEALVAVGIPFVVCQNESAQSTIPRTAISSNVQLLNMKPVVLMTMHRAKGEEYDDVYLAGWTEGVFPHPTSVSTNRVHEERRLAYVALTRARGQVMITHSFMRRALHRGPDLSTKYVTEQVRPSRFLHELVPRARFSNEDVVDNSSESRGVKGHCSVPSVIWNRARGIKEHVAGSSLPDYFAKSYRVPKGFVSTEIQNALHSDPENTILMNNSEERETSRDDGVACRPQLSETDEILVDTIDKAFNEIREKKRGTEKKYRAKFRELLKVRFGIARGRALVLDCPNSSAISPDGLVLARKATRTKPLCKCKAMELGQYVYYLIVSGDEE